MVWAAYAVVTLGLIVLSQTLANYGDEGFHLLAAQLVNAGRVPYRDFFYQHPPLFVYLYAGWFRVAGDTWQSAHLLSAMLTAAMVRLAVGDVLTRQSAQRTWIGILAVVVVGANAQVAELGTVGHPYALCMFLSVFGYRLATAGCRLDRPAITLAAGVVCGGAVLSSFLVAPILPIVAIWLLVRRQTARPYGHFLHFAGGAALWLLPLAWLFLQALRAIVFDLFEYHLFYRGASFRIQPFGSVLRGIWQLLAWLVLGDGLPRSLLALMGAWALLAHRMSDDQRRAELGLVVAITTGLSLFITLPHPTFAFYFVVVAPFVGILACHSYCWLDRNVRHLRRPRLLFPAVAVLQIGASSTTLIRTSAIVPHAWRGPEVHAAEINRMVPPHEPIYAEFDLIYFMTRRVPPAGLENSFSAELRISPDVAAAIKAVPQEEIDEWIGQGRFSAVLVAADNPRNRTLALEAIYGPPTKSSNAETGLLYLKKARS